MNEKDGERPRPCLSESRHTQKQSLGSSEKWGVGGTTHLSRKALCSHSLPVSCFSWSSSIQEGSRHSQEAAEQTGTTQFQ